MKYGDRWAKKHGSTTDCSNFACKTHTKSLDGSADERIESVEMIVGRNHDWNIVFVYKATFKTNKGELIACGGENPDSGKQYEKFDGYRLQYISGRYGTLVDMLQFHWTES